MEGPLTFKEKRWALNHPVQATESPIFKEALVALSERFGGESIVLPVHDTVMQFKSDIHFEEHKTEAENIMLAAFRNRCPVLNERVSAGNFSD
jgi:DNA polymerase I-like protein with 3'-5' exonuclease and polymerase domains